MPLQLQKNSSPKDETSSEKETEMNFIRIIDDRRDWQTMGLAPKQATHAERSKSSSCFLYSLK